MKYAVFTISTMNLKVMSKKITLLVTFFFALLTSSKAQIPPNVFNYSAVSLNAAGQPIASATIGIQIDILKTSPTGISQYSENHSVNTDSYGLFNLVIGAGAVQSGSMATIDWSNDDYYIKLGMDASGGTNFLTMGTTQLLSVPYALYAKSAGSVTGNIISSVSPAGDTLFLTNGQTLIIPGISAANIVVVPCLSGPTAIIDVTNPVTGKTWMDRNLGASQVATSSTDVLAYGDLYQWGRATDGHQCRNSLDTLWEALSSIDLPGHGNFILAPSAPNDWRSPQNDNLWQGVNGINNPCPSGYRIPTEPELEAERLSWGSNNSVGAFTSPLKLPMAGGRDSSSGSLSSVGADGAYWSSTISVAKLRNLGFSISDAGMYDSGRAFGLAVRCIKN